MMPLPLVAPAGGGSSKTTSRLRHGGCSPFPDRQVPLRHPRSIPPERNPLRWHGACSGKTFHGFHLLNHFTAICLVAAGAPAKRAAGGVTGATAEVGKVGHGAVAAPSRAGQAAGEPTPAAPTAPLPSPHRWQSMKISQPGPRKPTCLLTRC